MEPNTNISLTDENGVRGRLAQLQRAGAVVAELTAVYEQKLDLVTRLKALQSTEDDLIKQYTAIAGDVTTGPITSASVLGAGPEDEEDEGSKRKFVSRRWADFARSYLIRHGPTKLEAVFAAAPKELRDDFAEVESKFDSEFRARRMLRRNDDFAIDRNSGIVRLTSDLAPSLPELPDTPTVVVNWYRDSAKKVHFVLERDGQTEEIEFPELMERIDNGSGVWVTTALGYEPIAIRAGDAGNFTMSSFNAHGWTITLATRFIERAT